MCIRNHFILRASYHACVGIPVIILYALVKEVRQFFYWLSGAFHRVLLVGLGGIR